MSNLRSSPDRHDRAQASPGVTILLGTLLSWLALALPGCGDNDTTIHLPPMTFRESDLEISALLARAIAEGEAIRARFDLEHTIDPDAPALLAAMDASLRALATPLLPSSPVRAVPVRAGVSADTVGAQLPRSSFVLPWTIAMMSVDLALEFNQGLSETTSDAQTLKVGTSEGMLATSLSTSVQLAGSQLIVDVNLTMSGEAKDVASGATRFRIAGQGSTRIELDACPGPDGTIPVKVRIKGQEDYFLAGLIGVGRKEDIVIDGRLTVDDHARLVRADITTVTGDVSEKGRKGAGLFAYDLGGSATWSYIKNGEDWTLTESDGKLTKNDGGTWDDIRSLFGTMGLYSGTLFAVGKVAEEFWQSGKCIEVLVDPDGGEVEPDSQTTVTARVRHRFEGTDLAKPVEATLAGVRSLEPAGRPQPAPATVTYTAGSDEGDVGDLTFRSVSNRGIGETTVQFVARRDTWTGTTHGANALWSSTAQITWTRRARINNVVEYRPSGTVTTTPVSPNPCTLEPNSKAISPDDGWLYVDYNVSPPTFHGFAFTSWPAIWRCTSGNVDADAVGLLLGGSRGILVGEATGTVSGDARTIAGSDVAFGGTPGAITYNWSFMRN
jgi:hypothetical protein